MNRMKRIHLSILILILSCQTVFAQIRAGAAFLKILPGGRLHAMASSHTAVLDDLHAIFANPGNAGFLREWQLAATYTKWLADVYNGSVIYGGGVRTPWSSRTRFALGVLYQGVPEFDSSERTAPSADASDMVAAITLGQPLSVLSDNVAVGANIKYLKSQLEAFDASTWITDIGLTVRSRRFGLGNSIFPQGILSAGIAFSHFGQDLVFYHTGTPLPSTFRGGLAFYLGAHDGMQLLFATEYYKVKDEAGAVTVGTEFTLNRTLSFNGGIDFGSDLLKRCSFGASIRLDDINTVFGGAVPGRNNALRLDFASMDDIGFVPRTYRGGVSHYTLRPEGFRFLKYADGDTVLTDKVSLEWESSRDPDLFDDIYYTLIVDTDRSKLDRQIRSCDEGAVDLHTVLTDSSYLVNRRVDEPSFDLNDLNGGHYYWSVLAVDKDSHIRYASKNGDRIGHFYVPLPDIEIRDIDFEYSPWITQDDYHGVFHVTVKNRGDRRSVDFDVTLSDSLVKLHKAMTGAVMSDTILRLEVPELGAGDSVVVDFEWRTGLLGRHKMIVKADDSQKLAEADETNNSFAKDFYTIPKGFFGTGDTAPVLVNYQILFDLPVITEITFEKNSTVIDDGYMQNSHYKPPLLVIAERLVQNPQIKISLRGFSDQNSEQASTWLANRRAKKIREELLKMGVAPNQIDIIPGIELARRKVPKDSTDAKWVFEERRYVKITTAKEDEEILFAPVRMTDDEVMKEPVKFEAHIDYVVPHFGGSISCKGIGLIDTVPIDSREKLIGTYEWKPVTFIPRNWNDVKVNYSFSLVDTLERRFSTREREVVLTKVNVVQENHIVVPLVYADTKSVNDFLWEALYSRAKQLLDNPRVRFGVQGHACKTGPAEVNRRLSENRAKRFNDEFRDYIENKYNEDSRALLQRMDTAVGYGEDQPLKIKHIKGDTILIGDSERSIGRKLNRRIEIIFYLTE